MLKHSDIISIHCPYTPETFHLLSKKRLCLLKRNSIIINTSRGEIIDENELSELLLKKELVELDLMFLNMSHKLHKNYWTQTMLFFSHI